MEAPYEQGLHHPIDQYHESAVLLSQMFPDITLRVIKETLEDCSGDLDKATEILLNQSAIIEEDIDQDLTEQLPTSNDLNKNSPFPEEYLDEGNFLMEMFPHIPRDEILRQLKLEGKDMNRVYDILMNYSELKPKPKLKKIRMSLMDLDEPARPSKTWAQINDDVSQICELTGQSKQIAQNYFYKTNSVGSSIVAIVLNETLPVEVTESELPVVSSGRIVLNSGRVQSGNNTARKLPQETTKVEKEFLIKKESTPDPIEVERYKLQINDEFYVALLMYFQGDIKRTLAVCHIVSQDNTHSFKFTHAPKVHYNNQQSVETDNNFGNVPITHSNIPKRSESDHLKQFSQYMQQATESKDRLIKSYYSSQAWQSKSKATESRHAIEDTLQLQKINEFMRTGKLDLHNLTVQPAIDTVSKLLSRWWQEEIDRRTEVGKFLRSGRVRHVQEVKLVTGRGLHSEGGRSKLKPSVRKFLTSNGYQFEEDSSSFIVTGKKNV